MLKSKNETNLMENSLRGDSNERIEKIRKAMNNASDWKFKKSSKLDNKWGKQKQSH